MIAASLHHNRPWRMSAYALCLHGAAAKHAQRGDLARASQAAALAEALHWAAGGDRQGVQIALSDAKAYARIKRREAKHARLAAGVCAAAVCGRGAVVCLRRADAMSDEEMQALRAAAEKATPGPWVDGPGGDCCHGEVLAQEMIVAGEYGVTLPDDAAFIALANPAAVLALLDRVAAAEARGDAYAQQAAEAEEARDAALRRADAEAFAHDAARYTSDALQATTDAWDGRPVEPGRNQSAWFAVTHNGETLEIPIAWCPVERIWAIPGLGAVSPETVIAAAPSVRYLGPCLTPAEVAAREAAAWRAAVEAAAGVLDQRGLSHMTGGAYRNQADMDAAAIRALQPPADLAAAAAACDAMAEDTVLEFCKLIAEPYSEPLNSAVGCSKQADRLHFMRSVRNMAREAIRARGRAGA